MEDSPKNIEKVTTEWMQEAGLERPSANFTNHVMDAIQARAQASKSYQPLISKRGWGVIAALAVITLFAVYVLPMGELNYLNGLDFSKVPTIENPFKNVHVSNTMLYGIAFMGLFLVQIPFLKRRFIN